MTTPFTVSFVYDEPSRLWEVFVHNATTPLEALQGFNAVLLAAVEATPSIDHNLAIRQADGSYKIMLTTEDRERLARWLTDGQTWIGVFENHDLGHSHCGHRIAMPFDIDAFDSVVLGNTRAPDTATAINWRYILIAKCTTIEQATYWLEHHDKEVKH